MRRNFIVTHRVVATEFAEPIHSGNCLEPAFSQAILSEVGYSFVVPIIALMLVVKGRELPITRNLKGIKALELLLTIGRQLSKTYHLE